MLREWERERTREERGKRSREHDDRYAAYAHHVHHAAFFRTKSMKPNPKRILIRNNFMHARLFNSINIQMIAFLLGLSFCLSFVEASQLNRFIGWRSTLGRSLATMPNYSSWPMKSDTAWRALWRKKAIKETRRVVLFWLLLSNDKISEIIKRLSIPR